MAEPIPPKSVPSTEQGNVARAYDGAAGTYDAEFTGNVARAENQVVFELVRDAGCDRRRVLDLGCGTGLFLEHLPKAPDEYVGVDISPGMLTAAVRKFPRHAFHESSMTSMPFLQSGSFDSVVSLFSGFSYVQEPHEVVSETHRLLRPGGRFFVMTAGRGERQPETIGGEVVPRRIWGASELQAEWSMFVQLRVVGLEVLSRRLLAYIPAAPLARLLRFGTESIGRVWPDACHYVIVTGLKA